MSGAGSQDVRGLAPVTFAPGQQASVQQPGGGPGGSSNNPFASFGKGAGASVSKGGLPTPLPLPSQPGGTSDKHAAGAGRGGGKQSGPKGQANNNGAAPRQQSGQQPPKYVSPRYVHCRVWRC